MWNKIAEVINKTFNISRSGLQVENRYKTVMKRKKDAVEHNSKTGQNRVEVPYEEELNKIAALDDSIQPEVFGTAKGVKIMKKVTKQIPPDTKKKREEKSLKDSLCKVLKEMNNEREQEKERRHREKLDLLRELFGQPKK